MPEYVQHSTKKQMKWIMQSSKDLQKASESLKWLIYYSKEEYPQESRNILNGLANIISSLHAIHDFIEESNAGKEMNGPDEID